MALSTNDIKNGMSYAEISQIDSPALYSSLTADVVPAARDALAGTTLQTLIASLSDPTANTDHTVELILNVVSQLQASIAAPVTADLTAQQSVQGFISASTFSDALTANSGIVSLIQK